jgi:hypothetical protein
MAAISGMQAVLPSTRGYSLWLKNGTTEAAADSLAEAADEAVLTALPEAVLFAPQPPSTSAALPASATLQNCLRVIRFILFFLLWSGETAAGQSPRGGRQPA